MHNNGLSTFFSSISSFMSNAINKVNHLLRAFGAYSVSPYSVDSPILNQFEKNQTPNKSLSERNITHSNIPLTLLTTKYNSHRINKNNINSLFTDLNNIKLGKTKNESSESYQYRLKLAIEISGLAKISTDDESVILSKDTSSQLITPEKLEMIQTLLSFPPLEFYYRFSTNSLNDKTIEDNYLSSLNDVIWDNSDDSTTKIRISSMIARAILENTLPEIQEAQKNDVSIQECLIDTPLNLMSDMFVQTHQKLKEQFHHDDKKPSDSTIQGFYTNHNIHDVGGRADVTIEPSNKPQICLSAIYYLSTMYSSHITSMKMQQAELQAEETDNSQINPIKTHIDKIEYTQDFFHRMSHRLLRTHVPDSFAVKGPDHDPSDKDPVFSYQHFVIKDENNNVYFNGDQFQPRGGRKDLLPLISFEQYQLDNQNES